MALTQVKTLGIAADAITGAQIADDAVANEHIAADSVNPAQMVHGTDGNLLTYDTNGAPGYVATGNDGQVLTSQGAGNVPQFETPAAGVGGSSGVDFNDTVKVRFGSDNDSELYFDNSNTKWVTTNGNIRLLDQAIEFWNRAGNEAIAKFDADGSCELYYNNGKKFETTNAGATVTGTLTADLADNSINSEHYVDGSIDRVHLEADIIDGTKLADAAVAEEHIANGQVSNAKLANNSVNNDKMADDAVGVAELSASGTASSGTFLRGDNAWAAAGGKFSAYAMLEDNKGDGVNGGTFSSGGWRTRDLQTEVTDADSIVSFNASNHFLLAGNTNDHYLIRWRSPAYKVDVHTSKLWCNSDNSTDGWGSAAVCKGDNGIATTISQGMARVVGGYQYRIMAYSWQTISSEGFGSVWSAGWAKGIYTQVEIFKES